MPKYIVILFFLIQFKGSIVTAQVKSEPILVSKDTIKTKEINSLAPAKAAFYSAILPGLGQAYNKKYWKIPIVYAAIGVSLYAYSWNNKEYNSYRDAYKSRLAGNTDDEYYYLDEDRLISAQEYYQRNRSISLFVAIGFYILNIVDANVDAHLQQFNVNDNLTLSPEIDTKNINNKPNFGLSFNYKF